METFMDKESVLGEWLAYFDNSRICKTCKETTYEEIKKLAFLLQRKVKVAHIDW
jgi:hypothetical protein